MDPLVLDPQRLPGVDLCPIHLGGTGVAGILLTVRRARRRAAVPIHYDDMVFKSPLSEFRAEVATASLATEIRYVERGDTIAVPLDHADV